MKDPQLLIDLQDYMLMKGGVMTATMAEADDWTLDRVGHFIGFGMAVSEEENRRNQMGGKNG